MIYGRDILKVSVMGLNSFLVKTSITKLLFFDDFAEVDAKPFGLPILGKTENILDVFSQGTFECLMIGIGYKHMKSRKDLFDLFYGKIPFAKIIHPTVLIDETAKIGEGVILYPGVVIDSHVTIKSNVLINVASVVAHDSIVEEHCFLSPRVAIAGFVKVEPKCILGINSTIIDNIEIVENTQVGGATNVIKSISEPGLYVGNPARLVRKF